MQLKIMNTTLKKIAAAGQQIRNFNGAFISGITKLINKIEKGQNAITKSIIDGQNAVANTIIERNRNVTSSITSFIETIQSSQSIFQTAYCHTTGFHSHYCSTMQSPKPRRP